MSKYIERCKNYILTIYDWVDPDGPEYKLNTNKKRYPCVMFDHLKSGWHPLEYFEDADDEWEIARFARYLKVYELASEKTGEDSGPEYGKVFDSLYMDPNFRPFE
jgi:hypothetical protein